ncbi:MAG: hypothetical protein V3R94_01210 [Acidobacteriota bacterium]
MMICNEVERLLTEDISQGNDAQVQKHIEQCLSCKKLHQELESMGELTVLLREMDKAPADFSSRVYARLRQPSLWFLQWHPVPALALVILALLSSLWILEVQPAPEAVLGSEEASQGEQFARVDDEEIELTDGDGVEGPYVDVIMESPSESEYIIRLPSQIKVRTSDLTSDIYLNNASY